MIAYLETETPRGVTSSFLNWLSDEAWSHNQLIRFLQGYDLPPGDSQAAPFQRLLDELPEVGRVEAKKKLATRAASLLAEQPDVKRTGEDPDEVLYNLLQLCAGLPEIPESRQESRAVGVDLHVPAEREKTSVRRLLGQLFDSRVGQRPILHDDVPEVGPHTHRFDRRIAGQGAVAHECRPARLPLGGSEGGGLGGAAAAGGSR